MACVLLNLKHNDTQRQEMAAADNKIMSINATIPTKDPIKEPEMRSQKELNCWQMANQFALAFPLCAKYTIAAAAEAPAVRRASIAYTMTNSLVYIRELILIDGKMNYYFKAEE